MPTSKKLFDGKDVPQLPPEFRHILAAPLRVLIYGSQDTWTLEVQLGTEAYGSALASLRKVLDYAGEGVRLSLVDSPLTSTISISARGAPSGLPDAKVLAGRSAGGIVVSKFVTPAASFIRRLKRGSRAR